MNFKLVLRITGFTLLIEAAAMLRRALIVAAFVIAVSVGL